MAEAVQVHRAAELEGIPHGFLGRVGGVSTGLVAGLNLGLGTGDDAAAVAENRARAVAAVLPDARLVTVYQVHSADCVVAGEWSDDARPHADALATDQPGLLLGVVTADCAPVLLADRSAGVIGAAHAGWKGAVSGVTDSTIVAMEALGAKRGNIVAAVGPCIAQPSYEVDAGFYQRFVAQDPGNAAYFVPGVPDHWQFDLERYVAERLQQAGIGAVGRLGLDTYPDENAFFSFRRATHRGEPDYGRQMSLIGLD